MISSTPRLCANDQLSGFAANVPRHHAYVADPRHVVSSKASPATSIGPTYLVHCVIDGMHTNQQLLSFRFNYVRDFLVRRCVSRCIYTSWHTPRANMVGCTVIRYPYMKNGTECASQVQGSYCSTETYQLVFGTTQRASSHLCKIRGRPLSLAH
eukprot:scaffold315035_cov28-Tisochrysis_lutea.AAC.2